mgnify:CR=1 FL=1
MIIKFQVLVKNLLVNISKILAIFIRKLPVSSEFIGPPKGLHESAKKFILNSDFEVYPAHIIHSSKPETIDEIVHWKFRTNYKRQAPPLFTAIVPGGRVWGSMGAIITQDDKLLGEVSQFVGGRLSDHPALFQVRLPSVSRLNGKVAVLSTSGGEGYFHWMMQVLPRIGILNSCKTFNEKIDYFIVNSQALPFQKETLRYLNIPEEKLVDSNRYPHIKADQLIVPSVPQQLPKFCVDFIRKSFLDNPLVNQAISLKNLSSRIYISRSQASRRRITNENKLISLLKSLNFTMLTLESMSIAEQVKLFSVAEIIVAPHGAGLTNLAFCNEGTKVIEIFSPNYINICYYAMSNHLGLSYYYLIGEGNAPAEYVDPHQGDSDIYVDVEKLKQILKIADII